MRLAALVVCVLLLPAAVEAAPEAADDWDVGWVYVINGAGGALAGGAFGVEASNSGSGMVLGAAVGGLGSIVLNRWPPIRWTASLSPRS